MGKVYIKVIKKYSFAGDINRKTVFKYIKVSYKDTNMSFINYSYTNTKSKVKSYMLLKFFLNFKLRIKKKKTLILNYFHHRVLYGYVYQQ